MSTDSSTDMGDTGSETSASRSTGNVVDIRVDDDELESSEHENAYLVGSGHQMLNADDIRNAVSPVRRQASGTVVADMKAPGSDSMAAENMIRLFPDLVCAKSAAEALSGADGCLVMTEWPEFSKLDKEFDKMKSRVIIDGRHILTIPDAEGVCW